MTRPEGVVLLVALGLLLLIMQVVPGWRRPWRWTLAAGANLVLVAAVVGMPYFLTTRHFTNKPSSHLLEGTRKITSEGQIHLPPGQKLPAGLHSAARIAGPPPPLAVWLENDMRLWQRRAAGLWAVVWELVKGFHYLAWLPALLGLWWSRHRLFREPGAWLLVLLCMVHTLVLWRLAVVAKYVSERHVLLLVLCGLFPAVEGVRGLAARLSALWRRNQEANGLAPRPRPWSRLLASAPALSILLFLGLAGSGLPKTLQRLHVNRAGHRAAGLWLAEHTRSTDMVCDGHFGWAWYYAGRLFLEPPPNSPTPISGRMLYIVKGTSREHENPYGPTNTKADYTEKEIVAVGGKIVFQWPPDNSNSKGRVVIWVVRLPG
jgi:hypothetical protein